MGADAEHGAGMLSSTDIDMSAGSIGVGVDSCDGGCTGSSAGVSAGIVSVLVSG